MVRRVRGTDSARAIFPNPIILIILLIAGFETYERWQLRRAGSAQQAVYYRVRPLDCALVSIVDLGLVGSLAVGMHATNLHATFA